MVLVSTRTAPAPDLIPTQSYDPLMTEPERPQPIPSPESPLSAPDTDETPEAVEPEPEPEPWTAERVSEWNAYYDVYVALGLVLLVFVVSAHRITHSTIWAQLQTGRLIAANSAPVLTDPFSYTEPGHRWVNVPWLFEWSHALVYKAASDLTPIDRNDPVASAAFAEQVGAGALVAINALVRVLTVLLLLGIRRPGPGHWWSAACALLAMGVVWIPAGVGSGGFGAGVVLGGVAGVGQVSPETWGMLLLALELLILHRTIHLGRRNAVFALVPVFLLWANLDESFLIGLLVLAATVIGRLGDSPRGANRPDLDTDPMSVGRGLAVLGACAAACLANPSFYRIFPAAMEPLFALFRQSKGVLTVDQLSYFGNRIRQPDQAGAEWVNLAAYYLIVVGLGLVSFLLNRGRFSLGRFLTYAVMALLWGVYIRFGVEFAIVFVGVVALNGQEWYHDRFGTEGRLGRGWSLWSVGGRAVTIIVIFAFVAKGLTGWRAHAGEAQFGFGFQPEDFSFEAAEYLKTAPIRGNVLNTSLQQGDSLIWRAYPLRKTFIDGRHHFFSPATRLLLEETRVALRDDAIERWKPILDRYEISAVMIQESSSPNTYRRLMQSPNWIPFYDDGGVILFGRADAPAADLAYFQGQRLDAEAIAYERAKPFPSFDRAPTPVGWMDEIFQHRSMARPQPHIEAGRRWLAGAGAEGFTPSYPDPARCLLAIREARLALARRPDDWRAYRLLATAYRLLMREESALLAGIAPTPENMEQVLNAPLQTRPLMNRFRQLVTSLNFAVQTTPPPRTKEERAELQGLHMELYQLYLGVNYLDLARDHFRAALEGAVPGDIPPEVRGPMTIELAQLDERMTEVQTRLGDLAIERQAGPLERASFAMSQGAVDLALSELAEAEQLSGASPTIIKPQLIDLYCDTGQPEKALDLLGGSADAEDPTLGTEPGGAALRQGRVHSLLGNYEYAATFWVQRAIPGMQYELARMAPATSQAFLKGAIKPATREFLTIPGKISMQASLENEAALCLLEAGQPRAAAEHFAQALTLEPNLATRPVAAYYLEKLGMPVPPAPEADKPGAAATAPAETPAAPSNDPLSPQGPATKDQPAEAKPDKKE